VIVLPALAKCCGSAAPLAMAVWRRGLAGGVWCGVVWCGVVWCGVVWCGVVWCGVVRSGVEWCGVVWDRVGPLRTPAPLLRAPPRRASARALSAPPRRNGIVARARAMSGGIGSRAQLTAMFQTLKEDIVAEVTLVVSRALDTERATVCDALATAEERVQERLGGFEKTQSQFVEYIDASWEEMVAYVKNGAPQAPAQPGLAPTVSRFDLGLGKTAREKVSVSVRRLFF
jgi:hypothetical protein